MSSASKLRRLAVVALAVALVAQPMATPVAAASSSPDSPCAPGEEALVELLSPISPQSSACEEYLEKASQTKATVVVSAKSARDQAKVFETVGANQLDRARTNIIARANVRAVRLIKDGKNESQVKSNVSAMINDTYASMQINMKESYNSSMSQLYYASNISEEIGIHVYGSNEKGVIWNKNPNGAYDAQQSQSFQAYNFTLVNGTEVDYFSTDDKGTNGWALTPFDDDSYINHSIRYSEDGKVIEDANANDQNTRLAVSESDWYHLNKDIEEQHQWALNNSRGYVTDLFDTYNQSDFDELSTDELLTVGGQVFLTSNTTGTGSYSARRALATATDLNTSVNASWVIDYDPHGPITYRGDTSVSGTVLNVTVDSPTLGDGAVYQDGERFFVNVTTDKNVTDVELLAENGSAASVNLTDNVGDRYGTSLHNTSFESVSTTGNVTVSVRVTTENGDVSTVKLGDWRYRPSGNVTLELAGGLFTNWRPASTDGSFMKNETYNTSNTGKIVQFVHQLGPENSQSRNLDGEFTVKQLTNVATGNELNQTATEDVYVQETWNASLSKQAVDEQLRYIDRYETNYGDGGGGGGGGGGFSFDFGTAGIGFIAIAGGALIILSNRS